MIAQLQLEGCDYKVDRQVLFPQYEGLELRMKLPCVIDLRGVPSEKFHSSDHYHWWNNRGDFYIDCTGHATYSPVKRMEGKWVYLLSQDLAPDFDSLYRWTEGQFDRFKFSLFNMPEQLRKGFIQGMPKERAVEVIRTTPAILEYLTAFFAWIELFAKEHGEQHFHPPGFFQFLE